MNYRSMRTQTLERLARKKRNWNNGYTANTADNFRTFKQLESESLNNIENRNTNYPSENLTQKFSFKNEYALNELENYNKKIIAILEKLRKSILITRCKYREEGQQSRNSCRFTATK